MTMIHIGIDGDQYCATFPGFTNLQECPAGFGYDTGEATADLIENYLLD
jgi:hypothetical protein